MNCNHINDGWFIFKILVQHFWRSGRDKQIQKINNGFEKLGQLFKMSAEAEKVISLSLCKIAETRGTRRGGTSLHKHLLIASVLSKATRARTAILDNWYMGGDTSQESVDLNMSYQEEDFPTDELDSNVGESSLLDIDPSLIEPTNSEMTSTSSPLLGNPRFGTGSETEIDLPPDILNCVEKLSDLNERMFPSQSASQNNQPVNNVPNPSVPKDTSVFVPPPSSTPEIPSDSPQTIVPVTSETENTHEDSHLTTTLTYLDLDAGSPIVERGPLATSTPAKRRREWCFEDDEDDDICGDSSDLYLESPDRKPLPTLFAKNCKRLRFDDSGLSSPEKMGDEAAVPSRRADDESDDSFKAGSFRLTYEDVDGDDSDDDSFLEDALNQGLPSPSQIDMPSKARHRNDRRVPSASSSGSCSDEDGEGESSMEVDQITNLVQFISFNKQQQSQSQNAANLRSISCVN